MKLRGKQIRQSLETTDPALARRKLAVGGLFYLSYNTTPGWSAAIPLRHLMFLHTELAADTQGIIGKIDSAVNFAQQVSESGALYFRSNPAAAQYSTSCKAGSGVRRPPTATATTSNGR